VWHPDTPGDIIDLEFLVGSPTPMAHLHAVIAQLLLCPAAQTQETAGRTLQQAIASQQAAAPSQGKLE